MTSNRMASEIVLRLEKMGSRGCVASNGRVRNPPAKTVSLQVPELRRIANEIGMDHALSLDLWETGLREAHIIATLTADPECTTIKVMKRWADSADSWDVLDACCCNLFWKTKEVDEMIKISCNAKGEMSKRFCFALIAYQAKKDRSVGDEKFKEYFGMISSERSDKRHYVSKAVDWAVRAIAARNESLNRMVSDHFGGSRRGKSEGSTKSTCLAADTQPKHGASKKNRPMRKDTTKRRVKKGAGEPQKPI